MLDQIERVLDEKVRPSLRLHGGNIEVIDFRDGILRFRFLGHCSGCPSAGLTTEQLVQEEVCGALPQVKQVALVQEVSQSLLDEARRILRHE